MVNIDDALAHSIFGRMHSVLISQAGQCPAGLSQRTRLEKLCWFRFFQYFSNSTPFDPPSRPREAQWKPHDLLLFLTWPVPEWPYLVNPRPFPTPAYLLLSGVDGERPVRFHPRPLARLLALLVGGDQAQGHVGHHRGVGRPRAEHLHLALSWVAQPGERERCYSSSPSSTTSPPTSQHPSSPLHTSGSLTEPGRKVQAPPSSGAEKLELLVVLLLDRHQPEHQES